MRPLCCGVLAIVLAGTFHRGAIRGDEDLAVKPVNDDNQKFPAIPEPVTSFGAAILDGALYVYGGHMGRAHEYYKEAHANTLYRLDLKNPQGWQTLGKGPGLQGLAMVAHGGKLYRLGGFTARNSDGQPQDLWSQAEAACYDPATKKWSELPPLPEPRSSFDAAALGDKLYVVGGWQLRGEQESVWHQTAYELDLATSPPVWKALPEPPFQRRALALAAYEGKLLAIGGMQREGQPTTRVDIYDPATGKWSQGPSLNGEPMEGFGCSAFATGGRMYVSTLKGNLQRLSADGKSWENIRELQRARFFHRMLPLAENRLLMIGGASMTTGKFEELDAVEVPSK